MCGIVGVRNVVDRPPVDPATLGQMVSTLHHPKQRPHRLNAAQLLDFSGGAGRDRTDDLLNAIQALSQLSYSPE
jgi:hypothetical protein